MQYLVKLTDMWRYVYCVVPGLHYGTQLIRIEKAHNIQHTPLSMCKFPWIPIFPLLSFTMGKT